MTDETIAPEATTATPAYDVKKLPFCAKLKSLRETKGIERKEVATHLRLSEKKIMMMENDRYPADLPVTFIKGYLRAYARYLQIPEHEIKNALDIIKPKPNIRIQENHLNTPLKKEPYLMHFFTFIILLSMLILVGMWWYSHNFLGSSYDKISNKVSELIEFQSNKYST